MTAMKEQKSEENKSALDKFLDMISNITFYDCFGANGVVK